MSGRKWIIIANYIAYILTLLGALNWGLVGIFNFNLVGWICAGFRSGWAIAIYVIIMLAAIWLIISPILSKGMLDLGCQYKSAAQQEKNDTKTA